MTKPPRLQYYHYPVSLRSSHICQYSSRQFHTIAPRLNTHSRPPPALSSSPQPQPQPQPQPPHHPHKRTHSDPHSGPSHRQIGKFSLPVFLFFAFTFAAITTSMDTTRPTPHRKSPPSQTTNNPDDDASPTSPFVDDNGSPLVPADSYDYNEADDPLEGNKGIRDVDKERQHDTFNRYGRQRRVPWTLKEVAEAERWQRESPGIAMKQEGEREDERRRE